MAGENIFAIQLSKPQPQQVNPVYGNRIEDGLRAVLSVRMVWAKLQTTVLFGDSLYMIWYDVGQFDRFTGFNLFLKPYFGLSIPCAQLSAPPYAATPNLYNMQLIGMGAIPPEPPPVATANVTMLASGFDPLRGYWIEFAGNYFLGFPLFQNWPNVIRDTMNYKGFQPSANNPGPGTGGTAGGNGQNNGSSGSGNGGSNCPPGGMTW